MAEISSSFFSGAFFSSWQSKSGACAVWKVEDFSTLKERQCVSPVFSFGCVKWHLDLYPFGYQDSGSVGLFLRPLSPFLGRLQYECIVKNDSGKDFRHGEESWNFSANKGRGFAMFNRQDLLDGKFGIVLPNDLLTICCKMKMVNNVKTEAESIPGSVESLTESVLNHERNSFLIKYEKTLDSGRLSDVVLRVGEDTFPAHKVILSTHSEVFQAMFDSNLKESQDNIVDLIDMDSTVAKAMLFYIYTSEVEKLSPEKTLELYVAADRYMLTELKEECRDYVSEEMTAKTVLEVFEVAKLHSDAQLLQTAKTFFACNVKSILKSEEWKENSVQRSTSCVELLSYAVTSNDLFFFSS